MIGGGSRPSAGGVVGREGGRGVAGPEAADDAARRPGPPPSLGLPTSATAAILLAAFRTPADPGPLFLNNPDLVWGLIASLYIGNVMLLVLNLPWWASGYASS